MSLTRKIIDFLTGRPSPRRLRFDDSTSIVPGDMVVCIVSGRPSFLRPDGTFGGWADGPYPQLGFRYHVDDVCPSPRGAIGLRLREFPSDKWRVTCFRKVRKTSIECLQSLLNPSPEEVLAGTAGGNDYDVPSVAADERTGFLPGVSSRCLTARLLLNGGDGPSFLHRVTSRERLGSDEPGTAGARPLGGGGGGGEPPLRGGDEHITTGDTRDVGILTRACG
ncbi:hypothetical protein [Ancylobacter polymorphus]|uniref:Uncharacterized protein n=1 Tax=Ancylobacter polymorphus TaxID=223390 RepID=A0ABU0BIQ4_9HYPH|nr:hypothetical protein [Ancylobacter polymorphus]MDQ0305305.1 hypothetical protein [Ancylobacter polymorphus]